MKRFNLSKRLKTQTDREHGGSSAESETFTLIDKNARNLEEECGLFILHDLPHDLVNALEYVL